MQVSTTVSELTPKLAFSEIMSFAFDTFCANKVRFLLTGLGMVIGTASLILVVTIGMTGKQYVLNLIQGIGANLIYAEYEGGAQRITNTAPDTLTVEDMQAAQASVPGITSASPVLDLNERVPVGNGKERDLQILGVYPEYRNVRNLVVVSGRFFDAQDEQAHNKVGLVTDTLAKQLYGSPEAAVGKIVPLSHLPFTVIGTFRERVNTFGESEVTTSTFLIPYSVARYFTETASVKLIYFSVSDPSMIEPVTNQIKEVIQSRHRAESVYSVTNLTQALPTRPQTRSPWCCWRWPRSFCWSAESES
jgi:putative ABC transport system permease protein